MPLPALRLPLTQSPLFLLSGPEVNQLEQEYLAARGA